MTSARYIGIAKSTSMGTLKGKAVIPEKLSTALGPYTLNPFRINHASIGVIMMVAVSRYSINR